MSHICDKRQISVQDNLNFQNAFGIFKQYMNKLYGIQVYKMTDKK
jgi:hypothetical protein